MFVVGSVDVGGGLDAEGAEGGFAWYGGGGVLGVVVTCGVGEKFDSMPSIGWSIGSSSSSVSSSSTSAVMALIDGIFWYL